MNLKSNQIVMNAIAMILNMNISNDQNDYTCISSSDPQSIQSIIQYFNHTLKGIKSLEFKLWSRSFTKRLSYSQLEDLRIKINKIQNKHKDINSLFNIFNFIDSIRNCLVCSSFKHVVQLRFNRNIFDCCCCCCCLIFFIIVDADVFIFSVDDNPE